jgi:hypothetical protein
MNPYIVDVAHAVAAERLRQAQATSAGRRLRAERRGPRRRRVPWQPRPWRRVSPGPVGVAAGVER